MKRRFFVTFDVDVDIEGDPQGEVVLEALFEKIGKTQPASTGDLIDLALINEYQPTSWEISTHERHVDLMAHCVLCVLEAGEQTDRLTHDEEDE